MYIVKLLNGKETKHETFNNVYAHLHNDVKDFPFIYTSKKHVKGDEKVTEIIQITREDISKYRTVNIHNKI